MARRSFPLIAVPLGRDSVRAKKREAGRGIAAAPDPAWTTRRSSSGVCVLRWAQASAWSEVLPLAINDFARLAADEAAIGLPPATNAAWADLRLPVAVIQRLGAVPGCARQPCGDEPERGCQAGAEERSAVHLRVLWRPVVAFQTGLPSLSGDYPPHATGEPTASATNASTRSSALSRETGRTASSRTSTSCSVPACTQYSATTCPWL